MLSFVALLLLLLVCSTCVCGRVGRARGKQCTAHHSRESQDAPALLAHSVHSITATIATAATNFYSFETTKMSTIPSDLDAALQACRALGLAACLNCRRVVDVIPSLACGALPHSLGVCQHGFMAVITETGRVQPYLGYLFWGGHCR